VRDAEVHIYGEVGGDAEARLLLALARIVPGVAHAELHAARQPVALASASSPHIRTGQPCERGRARVATIVGQERRLSR
jgi:hypothetical protein